MVVSDPLARRGAYGLPPLPNLPAIIPRVQFYKMASYGALICGIQVNCRSYDAQEGVTHWNDEPVTFGWSVGADMVRFQCAFPRPTDSY